MYLLPLRAAADPWKGASRVIDCEAIGGWEGEKVRRVGG